MKTISIVTACYNEEDNVEELYHRVKSELKKTPYEYEHLFIDNCSTDRTVEILKKLAADDPGVKVIVNTRNFGHIRSPYHGLLQASGDAVISIVADLQDPPELIIEFIKAWESGHKIVVGTKQQCKESRWLYYSRKLFYKLISRISDINLIKDYTGFGLYDRAVLEAMKKYEDPYPYFRGLISEIGFEVAVVSYVQPSRKRGLTKNNFFSLFDMAMLGCTIYAKFPIRIITMIGGALTLLSLILLPVTITLKTLIFREMHWGFLLFHSIFLLFSLQCLIMGVIGEYILTINSRSHKRPHVIENYRINFSQKTTTIHQ